MSKRYIGIGLAAILLLAGCGQKGTDTNVPELKNPAGVEVDMTEVKKMDLSEETVYSAQVIPKIIEVSFDMSGDIGEMKVAIGDKVKKGQVVATLSGSSDKEEKAALEETLKSARKGYKEENSYAQAEIDAKEKELKELNAQYKKKQSKSLKNQIETTKYDIRIAKKKLEQKKEVQQLDINRKQKEISEFGTKKGSRTLKAPIDGEVISIIGGTGHMIQAGSAAVCIADMSSPRIKTEYIGDETLNKASSYIAVVNGKEYEVEAEEQEVEAYAVETGVGLPTETNFDFVKKNVDLKIGEFALIELRRDTAKEALVLPVNAVKKDSQGKYVYVQEKGGKVRREVTVGTTTAAYSQILTGVKEGKEVYVEN